MKSLESVSFVIPAYNEQDNIQQVIHDAYETGKSLKRDFEILVVDDASSDQTPKILKSPTLPSSLTQRLRVITHSTNLGCGAALRTLYTNAQKDLIFYIPADRQIRAQEITKFLPKIEKNDMVLAHRHVRHDPVYRRSISQCYHLLVRIILGLPFPDIEGSILFRRNLISSTGKPDNRTTKKLIPLRSSGVFVETELIYRTYKAGYPIASVKIEHFARQGHKTQRAFIRDAILAAVEFSKHAIALRLGKY